MEAVEFIRTIQKMCAGTDCDDCPLNAKNGCNMCYAEDPVESVRIVEEWAAEQERQKAERERQKAEQERQKAEQERQKPEQGVVGCLDPETSMEVLGFMKQRKRMCDYYGDDTCVCDDSRGECPALDMDCSFTTDHPEHLIAIVEQWAKEHPEKPEPKRTNKDVLLAAFPDAYVYPGGVPLACPLSLDKHYECSKFKNCEDCRTTHWPADAE